MKTVSLNGRSNILCALVLLATAALYPRGAYASQGGFTVSVTNETVAQGMLGSSSIIVTPLNGYTGNISFTATASMPALTNGCVLFTNYANASGANPTTVGSLAVATQNWDCPPDSLGNAIGGGTVSEVRRGGSRRPGGTKDSNPLEVALGGILLTALFGVRSEKLRRLSCLLVLATVGGFAMGCSNPKPLMTPKGSYILTVVGTDHDATPNITASTTFTVAIH